MDLKPEHIEAVKKWVADGAGISQVQKMLSAQFGINMTYMDVRFVLDDIDAQLKDAAPTVSDLSLDAHPPAAKTPKAEMPSGNAGEIADMQDAPQDTADNAEQGDVAGEVSVSQNPIPRPGAMMGGEVVFSDGGKAEWVLDQNGQLGLIPATEGYNPPQKDLPVFQNKLRELLGMEAAEEPVEDGAPAEAVNDDAVQVSLSPVQRPDCLAFGDVSFSNGAKAEWRLGSDGALSLIPADRAKTPPKAEVSVFRRKLQALLQKMY